MTRAEVEAILGPALVALLWAAPHALAVCETRAQAYDLLDQTFGADAYRALAALIRADRAGGQ